MVSLYSRYKPWLYHHRSCQPASASAGERLRLHQLSFDQCTSTKTRWVHFIEFSIYVQSILLMSPCNCTLKVYDNEMLHFWRLLMKTYGRYGTCGDKKCVCLFVWVIAIVSVTVTGNTTTTLTPTTTPTPTGERAISLLVLVHCVCYV